MPIWVEMRVKFLFQDKEKGTQISLNPFPIAGGADETRTRDLRRDRYMQKDVISVSYKNTKSLGVINRNKS